VALPTIYARATAHAGESSFIRVQLLLAMGILAGSVLSLLAAPVPTNKPSNYPAWWFSQGVIVPTNPTNSSPNWPTDYPISDDYAVINEGQLKNFATKAYNQLQAQVSSSTWTNSPGLALTSMVTGWSTSTGDDYTAINLGQLKTVAKPFYDFLVQTGYASGYPWTGLGADDSSAANIGQVKNVFNFAIAAPATPTNLTVSFNGTQATLSWNESINGAQNYQILYSTNGGATWSTLATIAGNITSTTVTGLTLGQNYNFQILASNPSGNSTASASDAAPIISLIAPAGATLAP
jgi:hypothetical protein